MSSLTKDDVKHVAKLSNLPITDKEVDTFQQQLTEVISYIEELEEVDVTDVEPTSQTTGLVNVTRADEVNVTRTLSQNEAVSTTENSHNGFFKVPPVILKSYDDQ